MGQVDNQEAFIYWSIRAEKFRHQAAAATKWLEENKRHLTPDQIAAGKQLIKLDLEQVALYERWAEQCRQKMEG